MVKFVQIRHKETKGGKVYSSYLGDVQADLPHKTRFYHKNSNQIIEVTVSELGEITKTVIKSKIRVCCPDSIAVIEREEKEKTNGKLSSREQTGKFKQKSRLVKTAKSDKTEIAETVENKLSKKA